MSELNQIQVFVLLSVLECVPCPSSSQMLAENEPAQLEKETMQVLISILKIFEYTPWKQISCKWHTLFTLNTKWQEIGRSCNLTICHIINNKVLLWKSGGLLSVLPSWSLILPYSKCLCTDIECPLCLLAFLCLPGFLATLKLSQILALWVACPCHLLPQCLWGEWEILERCCRAEAKVKCVEATSWLAQSWFRDG